MTSTHEHCWLSNMHTIGMGLHLVCKQLFLMVIAIALHFHAFSAHHDAGSDAVKTLVLYGKQLVCTGVSCERDLHVKTSVNRTAKTTS